MLVEGGQPSPSQMGFERKAIECSFLKLVIVTIVLVSELALFLAGCALDDTATAVSEPEIVPTSPPAAILDKRLVLDEWSLWSGGTQLRGANIWQRVVVPELDGGEFLGSGHVGPPYIQEDFDRLAALGANYVNISHSGLFTEEPPYELDEEVQTHLDNLLNMIARADMFAVITFRTGPGRSDFTFYRDGAGDWFDRDLLI